MRCDNCLWWMTCSVEQKELCMFYARTTKTKMDNLKKEYYDTDICKDNSSNVEDFFTFLAEHGIETERLEINHEITF